MFSRADKILLLLTLIVFMEAAAQFKLLDTPRADQLLEIHFLNASQSPRTRKIHNNPRNLPQKDPQVNIVRIFSDAQPNPVRKTTAKSGKYRGYKSKCRCERIWKCQKMQMSIARCPPDHFMCCF